MKKILALLLAGSLLTACGPEAKPIDPTNPDNGTESVVNSGEIKRLTTAPAATDWGTRYELYLALAKQNLDLATVLDPLQQSLLGFTEESFLTLLSSGDSSDNVLYSPLSLYVDLAMVAEAAAGETSEVLEQALNRDSGLTRSTRADAIQILMRLWHTELLDDNNKSLMSNALWLKEGIELTDLYKQKLAEIYYADTYTWSPGTEAAANEEIGKWVEEKTNDLIPRQSVAKDIPSPSDVMVFLNAVYFYSGWTETFDEDNNEKMPFHLADGSENSIDFMKSFDKNGSSYVTDQFQVASRSLSDGSEMRFLLPNENVNLAELADSDEFMNALLSNAADNEDSDIDWSVPKFDIDGSMDLMPLLDSLGLGSLRSELDLREGMENVPDGNALTSAKQAVRMKVNEKGVEAAAVTVIVGTTMAPPPKPVLEMKLDRPFYCSIISPEGIPSFVAYVANPTP